MSRWMNPVSLLAAILFVSGIAFALEPGSAGDPLVSKGYLEELYRWQVTTMVKGESLSLYQGTEIIIRSGKATVVEGTGGGLADLTSGRDLQDGEEIPPNHYILVPATDGRGLKADKDLILLVRGSLR